VVTLHMAASLSFPKLISFSVYICYAAQFEYSALTNTHSVSSFSLSVISIPSLWRLFIS